MTHEQTELLAAAVLLSMRHFGRASYSGKFSELAVVVRNQTGFDFGESDILEAIKILARLGSASISSRAVTSQFITVDDAKARAAFARQSNSNFNPRKTYPLLYEYIQFGESWLQEVWNEYFPREPALEAEANHGQEIAATPSPEDSEELVPASDRIVRIDHNQPDYQAIAQQLLDVREAVRSSNTLDADELERERILTSLTAAASLWGAGQLKLIQIKIGIVLAVEDAGRALATGTKAVAAALLVDAIKSFIKHLIGLDLDSVR